MKATTINLRMTAEDLAEAIRLKAERDVNSSLVEILNESGAPFAYLLDEKRLPSEFVVTISIGQADRPETPFVPGLPSSEKL